MEPREIEISISGWAVCSCACGGKNILYGTNVGECRENLLNPFARIFFICYMISDMKSDAKKLGLNTEEFHGENVKTSDGKLVWPRN